MNAQPLLLTPHHFPALHWGHGQHICSWWPDIYPLMHPLPPLQIIKMGFFRNSCMVNGDVGIDSYIMRPRTIDRATQWVYNEVIFLEIEAIFVQLWRKW